MSSQDSRAVIGPDLLVSGQILRARSVEVYGVVDGSIEVDHLIIHEGGRVLGSVTAQSAEINGVLRGKASIKNLIAIGKTGAVTGDVRYGRLSLAEGGDLSADLRNLPPELFGDMEIAVKRGASVRVTVADVTAADPNDGAADLTFSVTSPEHGHLALRAAPGVAVVQFTQADLEAGNVVFVHDGSNGDRASFAVSVSDDEGASSGEPRTVAVAVMAP